MFHQQVLHKEILPDCWSKWEQIFAGAHWSLRWRGGLASLAGWGFMILDTEHLEAEGILAHWGELGSTVHCIACGRTACSRQHELQRVLRRDSCFLINGDFSLKLIDREREATLTTRASYNKVVLNIYRMHSAVSQRRLSCGAVHMSSQNDTSTAISWSHIPLLLGSNISFPEMNHLSGYWPLHGPITPLGSWPVKTDLSQMSRAPQGGPDLNSPWWELLVQKKQHLKKRGIATTSCGI